MSHTQRSRGLQQVRDELFMNLPQNSFRKDTRTPEIEGGMKTLALWLVYECVQMFKEWQKTKICSQNTLKMFWLNNFTYNFANKTCKKKKNLLPVAARFWFNSQLCFYVKLKYKHIDCIFYISQLKWKIPRFSELDSFTLMTSEILSWNICLEMQDGERKQCEVQQSEVVCNVNLLAHWMNIFHFINMTKSTIIVDMPECCFH